MNKVPSAEEQRPFTVLVIEDEQLYAYAISRELRRHHIACDVAFTAHEGTEQARRNLYDAIILDHKLPDGDGISIIPVLLASQLSAPVVMMTAYETISNAITAIRMGAEDYLVKETSVRPIVQKVLELQQRAAVRKAWLNRDKPADAGLLGDSPAIKKVEEQLKKVSRGATTTVLLTGETGVGKEVTARYLHNLSCPNGEPLITIDCIALPDTLVESMLFGHEKGAFTGADRAREGAFSDGGSGTILLDEIGDMDLQLQDKLLRVLENRRYQRLGSTKEHPVNARVVAATNRDLAAMVTEGTFRFDLYQRLSAFPIEIPPLRERNGDILLLARHFLDFFAQSIDRELAPLSPETQQILLAYDYPGNVRELKNIIERAVILCDDGIIEAQHLPERMLQNGSSAGVACGSAAEAIPVDFVPGIDTLESLEMKMIQHALKISSGKKGDASKLLGISRFQLLRRLEKYGMTTQELEPAEGAKSHTGES